MQDERKEYVHLEVRFGMLVGEPVQRVLPELAEQLVFLHADVHLQRQVETPEPHPHALGSAQAMPSERVACVDPRPFGLFHIVVLRLGVHHDLEKRGVPMFPGQMLALLWFDRNNGPDLELLTGSLERKTRENKNARALARAAS